MTTKTYRGKSPTQLLRGAHVAPMQAGNFEILSLAVPGAIIAEGADGTMRLECGAGTLAHVELTPKAADRLSALLHARELAYATLANA